MRHKILKILKGSLYTVRISPVDVLYHDQRVGQIRLPRNVDFTAVQMRPLSLDRSKQLFKHRIVNDADLRQGIYEKPDRHTGMRKTVHEIHRAVDRVDYPSWRVGQLALATGSNCFFADEFVAGKLAAQAVDQQLFDFSVGFRYEVYVGSFCFDLFLFGVFFFYDLQC